MYPTELYKPRRGLDVLAISIALALFLLPIRGLIAQLEGDTWSNPLRLIPRLFVVGYYDLSYVAGLALAFFLMLWLARRRPRAQTWIVRVFWGVALFSLFAGAINIAVVKMLNKPFDYEWLYYSDFLTSLDARQALAASWSWSQLGLLALVFGAMTAIALLLRRGLLMLTLRPRIGTTAAIVAAVACLIYLPLATLGVRRETTDIGRLENPVVAFTASLFAGEDAHFAMSANPAVGHAPVRLVSAAPEEMLVRSSPEVRNVVIVVLESVAAEYVFSTWNGHEVTPVLSRNRDRGAVFTNVYAHAPLSVKSLVSLLCGTYPLVSNKVITAERPDIALPSLPSVLKLDGYRTIFINGADNRYKKTGDFAQHRGFDRVLDHRDIKCGETFEPYEADWHMNGVDDLCTMDTLIDWTEDSDRPFFGVVWTYMTHYPYYAPPNPIEFTADDENGLNRYLNGLRRADEAIGRLLASLEERGLDRSTLVVVVGDHGEAFGRHKQYGHAGRILEANVHVPCMLINPVLFPGGRKDDRVAGLRDIAPTVLQLLGKPMPETFQGRSLFEPTGEDAVHFFVPNAGKSSHYGYREGNLKLIYEPVQPVVEVYDLAADPEEMTNLAGSHAEFVERGKQRIAAWVRQQEEYFRGPLEGPGVERAAER